MGLFDSLFGPSKEEIMNNNKEVYKKFLFNLSQNPTHEYLKELTIQAGHEYYASQRKNKQLTAEDEAAVLQDIEKAIQEHQQLKEDELEMGDLSRRYQESLREA